MPTSQRDRIKLLTKVGIAALVEGIKAIPGVGSLIAAAVAGAGAYLEETIKAPDLPEQARDVVLQLKEDYRELLTSELHDHLDDNQLKLVLETTLEIVGLHGLSADELVEKARLDADTAAGLTFRQERVKEIFASLDSDARELTERLVTEYYRILLRRKDALNQIGVEALKAILNRLPDPDFYKRLQSQIAIIQNNQKELLDMERAAAAARAKKQDPAKMLRILALLASPVYDPKRPNKPPPPLDLQEEWSRLAEAVEKSNAPILLSRLMPPTLDKLRSALSPRAELQEIHPHVLHFSGHAWENGLLLEDQWGQTHFVSVQELMKGLHLPHPLDLVILNACESAARAESVAQVMLGSGLTRTVIGHPQPVQDDQAIAFAETLYRELTDGRPVAEALKQANRHISSHRALLFGDGDFRFENLQSGRPVVNDALPPGRLESRPGGWFFGRGKDLVKIAKALGNSRSRSSVVVVTGTPGIGKTSLALEAAHRNASRYEWVAYARGPTEEETKGVAGMILEIAEGLGVREDGGVERSLAVYLRHTTTLLVLDNLENLPEAEMAKLVRFLKGLRGGSDAIVTLRPSVQALEEMPHSVSVPLHDGLDSESALRYIWTLAKEKGIPLQPSQAEEIVEATGRHPRLIELVVAQASCGDLQSLLDDLKARGRSFESMLDRVMDWSAKHIGNAGKQAWRALQAFPAGLAPEPPLLAAVGGDEREARKALGELRRAAIADFYPRTQDWRWHATAAEYARKHWSMDEGEIRRTMERTLPAWTRWLKRLEERSAPKAIETERGNLEPLLKVCREAHRGTAMSFLTMLGNLLPHPDRTLSLRDFDADVYETVAWIADNEATRAAALSNLGNALSSLGRREKALKATDEAVRLRRELARKNRDTFLPYLATSLNNLGNRLSELGRREEALVATDEAVKLRRELAGKNRDAFLPYLAESLNNLGNALSSLGRRKEALAAMEEAVGLYREFVEKNRDAFLPYLAGSLNNLGKMLSDVGRREKALEATEEAVELYRELAGKNRDAFLPNLATSLGSRGSVLKGMERHAEAMESFGEGLRSLLPALRKYPAAFSKLSAALLRGYIASANAAGLTPDEDLVKEVKQILAELSSSRTAALLTAMFSAVEEAVGSGQPTEHEIFKFLTDVAADADAPAELRTLAERLLALLNGERDRAKLTVGLAPELSEAMEKLLARVSAER